ncbi:MAG: phosphatase PAP2 family protein [Lachnospiraceae bacterium]|nr:phosphatase PAP2 family protein [Lachnospiraceae bacterium]
MLNTIKRFDHGSLPWIQDKIQCEKLDKFFTIYTTTGDSGKIMIGSTALFLLFKKTRKAGLTAGLALANEAIFTNLLIKPVFKRDRPWVTLDDFAPLIFEDDPNSFPSGHTGAAFSVAMVLFRNFSRKWARFTGMIMAVLMGFSRMYVGVHFFTDVTVGALIGILSGVGADKMVKGISERRKN